VEILLQSGANPNAKTKDGETALGAALYGEHPEVAELLRAYGGK
jgi:ankyrin repeat protein